jgi:hypothetical protein
MTDSSDHRELFSVLEGLYTLLDQLAVVSPSIAILPPPETGIHTASDFDYPLELQPSAKAITYRGMNQSDFEDVRELIAGLDGELSPPSIIKLTDSSASVGVQYMYDAETSTSSKLTAEDSTWEC